MSEVALIQVCCLASALIVARATWRRPGGSRWLYCGLLVALWAAVAAPLLAPERTLVFRDALPVGAANVAVLREALLEFRLPLWSPYQHAGAPFLAIPLTQSLYPPRWLAALSCANPAEALELVALLHLALLALGGWLLGSELSLSRPGRAALCATLLLAGPTLSGLENVLARCAWVPLGLALLLRYRREPSPRALALASACLAAAFYAGSLQNVAWLALAAGLLWLRPGEGPRLGWRAGAYAALGLLALGLSAGLLLPTASFAGETTRGASSYEAATVWSFHPARLSELLLPFPFGLPFPARERYLGAAFAGRASELWFHSATLGAVPLLCALRALGEVPARARRARRVGLCLALLGLLLALGRHGPLGWLWSHTPYRVFRYPEKHLTLFALGGALLAGVGLEAFARERGRARRLAPWLALPALTLAGLIPLRAWTASLARELGASPPELVPQALAAASAQLAFLALLAWRPRPSARRSAALVVVLALTGLPAARRLVFDGPAQLGRAQPPAAAKLRTSQPLPPRVYRLSGGFGRLPEAGERDEEARAALRLATLEGNAGSLYRIEGLHGLLGVQLKRWERLRHTTALAAARGAAPFLLGPLRPDLRQVDLGLGVGLTRAPARPRVEVLDGVRWAPDEEAAWALLAEAPLSEVVALGPGPRGRGPARSRGSVRDLRRSRPELLQLEVSAEAPALLVLRESFMPGWEARVDGSPTPLVPVDGAFMGLRVEPGRHEVRLEYTPPGLGAGRWIALVSALLALGLWRRGREPAQR